MAVPVVPHCARNVAEPIDSPKTRKNIKEAHGGEPVAIGGHCATATAVVFGPVVTVDSTPVQDR